MSAGGVAYEEGTWTAPVSKRTWRFHFWRPPQPRAFLVIVHGFGEHGGRYWAVAEALAARGLSVAAPDLWGHGRSAGRRGDLSPVGECARELDGLITEALQPRSGCAQYTLLGHSFGALVALLLALEHPVGLRRVIVESPLLEIGFPLPWWKTAAARLFARWWPTFVFSMNLDVSWISHDPAVREAYRADPLVHDQITARTYAAILQARTHIREQAGTLRVPVLLLYGTEDHIISVSAAQQWFAGITAEKSSVAFPEAYHELHHETVRNQVLELISRWALA